MIGGGIGLLSFNNIEWYFDQLGVAFDNTLVMLFVRVTPPDAPDFVRVIFPTTPVYTRV